MTKMQRRFVPEMPSLAPAKAMSAIRFLFHHWKLLSERRTQLKEFGKFEVVLNDDSIWIVDKVDGVLWSLSNRVGERQVVSPMRISHRAKDKWDFK